MFGKVGERVNKEIADKLIAVVKLNFIDFKEEFPSADILEDLLLAAKKHHIFNLVFYGLNKCENPNQSEIQRLLPSVCKNISIDETQNMEIKKVERVFSDNGIDYMPLKGSVMKKYYPSSDMRTMTDFDVLIKLSQYDKIKPLMLEMGYSLKVESNHEFVWKKPSLHAELHKMLIPSYNADYYEFFREGWGLAQKDDTAANCFKMSDEDFYIFNFVHLCKHYRDGGVGIKHVLDLWVFENSNPHLDFDYIKAKTEEIGLYKFYLNIKKLIDVWFNEGVHDEISKILAERIIDSGAYGTRQTHLYSQVAKESSATSTFIIRMGHIFSMLFPPFSLMKNIFPILKKCPCLLPAMWIYKLMKLIVNPKKIAKQIKIVNKINSSNINGYKNELETIGLKFNSAEGK